MRNWCKKNITQKKITLSSLIHNDSFTQNGYLYINANWKLNDNRLSSYIGFLKMPCINFARNIHTYIYLYVYSNSYSCRLSSWYSPLSLLGFILCINWNGARPPLYLWDNLKFGSSMCMTMKLVSIVTFAQIFSYKRK